MGEFDNKVLMDRALYDLIYAHIAALEAALKVIAAGRGPGDEYWQDAVARMVFTAELALGSVHAKEVKS